MRARRNADSVSEGGNPQDEPGTSYYARKQGKHTKTNRLVQRAQKLAQRDFH